jgi:two-component system sensor histidine kinase RegB
VRDDGPGFAPEVLAKLGEPYVTSRPGAETMRSGHVGMGLGFFIAKTLLERTGAAVDFRNGRGGGAVVTARWARSAIEAPNGPDTFSGLDETPAAATQ